MKRSLKEIQDKGLSRDYDKLCLVNRNDLQRLVAVLKQKGVLGPGFEVPEYDKLIFDSDTGKVRGPRGKFFA